MRGPGAGASPRRRGGGVRGAGRRRPARRGGAGAYPGAPVWQGRPHVHVRRAASVGRVLGGGAPCGAASRGGRSRRWRRRKGWGVPGLGALSFCPASDGATGSGKLAAWSLWSFPTGPLGVLLVMLFLWSIVCRLVGVRGFACPQRHAAATRGLWPQRVHWGQLLLQF